MCACRGRCIYVYLQAEACAYMYVTPRHGCTYPHRPQTGAAMLLSHRRLEEGDALCPANGTAPVHVCGAASFAVKAALCLFIDDVWFYAYHRALHTNKWLFDTVHRPHHEFTAPFAWASHALHPVEVNGQVAVARV